jgi:hypothetical protein
MSSAHVGGTTLMFPISAPMFERSSAFSMLLYLLYKTVESFKDLVKINPSKSELVPLTKKHSDFSLRMDTEEIKQTEIKHLGIKRRNYSDVSNFSTHVRAI